jgi:hypothetical protein
MIITKEQFDYLSSDTITKKQYDVLIEQIEKRCDEIIRKIISEEHKNEHYCWDFDNRAWDDGGNFICDGYFDEKEYFNEVRIYIDSNIKNIIAEPFSLNNCLSFPTRWIWIENFYDEFLQERE